MAGDADLVCWECVGDSILRSWLREHGHVNICCSCGKRRIACPLPTLARKIDDVVRQFYQPAKETAHIVEESDNPQYWADGTPARELIQEIAGVEPELADGLDTYLSESEQQDVRDGGDAYYAGEPLEHIRAFPDEFMERWRYFEEHLKHEVRFFDEGGRRLLDELFGRLSSLAAGRTIVSIEPGGESSTVYRARIVDGASSFEQFLREPERHLGPPPPALARAGRMNPVGITVFYGAFSEDVAVAEIRPPVGGVVAVGKFKLMRAVRLLDLPALSLVYHTESIFSPEYDSLRNYVAFLNKLEQRLARPVLPSDEALEYLPTQAFAAYVANAMGLDGVIYRSTQVGAETEPFKPVDRAVCNIVLFGRAARVEGEHTAKANGNVTASSSVPVSSPGLELETLPSTWTPEFYNVRVDQASAAQETGEPGTLRIDPQPRFVKIRGVTVESSTLNIYLVRDGEVFVNDYEGEDEL